MTESELREKIAGLVENESSEAHLRSKNRRRLRRVRDIQKSDGLLHIINYGNHATHRRYIDWGFDGRTLLWGDRIFEKCGIGRDEGGDGGKTLEIRGKRRLSARDGGANYQQS